jgi:O-antigen/teichoic acid export membrane protein
MMLAYTFAWVLTRVTGGGTNMTVLYAMEDPRVPLAIYGASGSFNLLVNLFLVHRFGAVGAVLGTGLSMVGSSVTSGLIVIRRTGAFFPVVFALKVLAASLAGTWLAHALPRPGGVLGVALAGVVAIVVCVALLRLMRPLHDDDRRLLVRLNPRLQALVSRL